MKLKQGVCGALLLLAGVQQAAAEEDYRGFSVGYEALMVVQDEFGVILSADGTSFFGMQTDCINWSFNQNLEILIKLEGINMKVSLNGAFFESIEGTHGFGFQDVTVVSSAASMSSADITMNTEFERKSRLGEGAASVSLSMGEQRIEGRLPIRTGELLPIEAYRQLVQKLRDGEEKIELRVSALGVVESMEPREAEEIHAIYEVIDSPFDDYELPQTYDDVFAGDHWVVRAVLPPAQGTSDSEEMIFQIYESGAISYWLLTYEGAKVALRPNFASLIPDPGCS